jgi:hypothetical protein
VVQATHSREADDAGASAGTLLDQTPARRVLADAEVCPVNIVEGDEGADQPAKVALVQDDDLVEQFAADRGDEALIPLIAAGPVSGSHRQAAGWRRSCCRSHGSSGKPW